MRTLFAPRFAGLGIVFMLHRVVPAGSPCLYPGYEVPVDFLDHLLDFVIRSGWKPIGIADLHRRLSDPEPSRERFACFTFDDGYADNLTLALPLFRKYNAPMCVYIPTGALDRSLFYWWGGLEELILRNETVSLDLPGLPVSSLPAATFVQKRAAYDLLDDWCHTHPVEMLSLIPGLFARYGIDSQALFDRDALSPAQARELTADPLATVGSHGISHRRFRLLTPQELDGEMRVSRRILENAVDAPVEHFAYPFGGADSCGAREFAAARAAGYKTAVTTRRGNIFPAHAGHLHCLPRRAVRQVHHLMREALFGVGAIVRNEPVFVAE